MKSKILTALLASTSLFAGQVDDTARNEMTIVGIEARTTHIEGACEVTIPAHWQRFYTEGIFQSIPNKASNKIYGVYCEYNDDQTYTLLIGCEVDSAEDLPEGLVAKTFPASNYATYEVEGEFPKNLIATWCQVWEDQELTASRTFTGDFEEYDADFVPGEGKMKVFVALSE